MRDIKVSQAREMLIVMNDEEVPLMSTAPVRRRYEASEISGILAFREYNVAPEALAADGQRRASTELLEGAIGGFMAGGDHQAAADLAELLALHRYGARS